MDGCNYTIIFILFYIVALTFVMKTHFHYIGYILLLIVYLVNILYIMLNRTEYMGVIDKVFIPSPLTLFTQNNAFKLSIFLIVFFSLYSLIRMIDTYNYLIKQNKTYDITMSSDYYKNNINRFNITFIISNVVLMGLLIMMSMGLFNNNSNTRMYMYMWGILFLSFVPMLLQIGFSTSFSGMKYDFISKYSKDIQSKYDDWKTK
jgi:hypothetical protein